MRGFKALAMATLMAAGIALGATSARAVPLVTVKYEGLISLADANGATTTGVFAGLVGQLLRLQITYDVDTADSDAGDPGSGLYLNSIIDAVLTIGTDSYNDTGPGFINIVNDGLQGDRYVVSVPVGGSPAIDGLQVVGSRLSFTDDTATAFTNDLLTTQPPNPNDFPTETGLAALLLHPKDTFAEPQLVVTDIAFEVLAIQSTAIPEPGSFALLLSGLAGLGYIARRRR